MSASLIAKQRIMSEKKLLLDPLYPRILDPNLIKVYRIFKLLLEWIKLSIYKCLLPRESFLTFDRKIALWIVLSVFFITLIPLAVWEGSLTNEPPSTEYS